jgi:hypothetical protein
MNAGTIAMLAAAALLTLPADSQQRPSVAPAVYTSMDSSFRFSYPSDFQVCTAGKMDPCRLRFYIPPCEEDATICVVYPQKQVEGTNFGAAAFQVREIATPGESMTSAACVIPPTKTVRAGEPSPWPDFSIPAQHPDETIGGVVFVHGITGGVAMSHSNSVDLYRAFHRQTCYELSLTESQVNPNVFDPPIKTLTPAAQKDMDESLSEILHSFRFLK